MEKDLKELLKRVEANIRDHNGSAVPELLSGDRGDVPSELRGDIEETQKRNKHNAEFFSQPSLKLETNAKDLKFIWGKKTVLVYAGMTKDEIGDPIPYTFLFTIDGEEYHLNPLVFVRLNDEWAVW